MLNLIFKVLIIGAGPCGLRMAVEAALLGAKVTVVEMRDYIARNNVLHLWPFVIHDLKALGARVFSPKFCSGSVEHVSKYFVEKNRTAKFRLKKKFKCCCTSLIMLGVFGARLVSRISARGLA